MVEQITVFKLSATDFQRIFSRVFQRVGFQRVPGLLLNSLLNKKFVATREVNLGELSEMGAGEAADAVK